ncbi:uncharacterized protein LOC108910400 [Anoplophora glabripennis]|uniref:uncharacterized protein LOC108910400 n=1 Tax=Anoplophora glabripennis TaxID=217634 RepID=UPI00087363A9|nr:uncharacterized protein LOC108910400 [Anoplophora glabripennis]
MVNIFAILVVSCVLLHDANAQNEDDCTPNGVQQILLEANATLHWYMNPDEPCEITMFQVDIVGDKGDEYHFKITENSMDLSFLEVCEEWRFTIIPISHDVIGFGRTLREAIPLPPSADLTLAYFNATAIGGREVLLEWGLVNHVYGDCTLHYQLSVADEALGITQDVYVQGTSLHLTFLSPCVPYELGIRAVNRGHPTIEGPRIGMHFEIPAKPQIIPSLSSIEIGSTAVNMTWTLEGNANRCPLKALYLDAGNLFNISVPLLDTLESEPVLVELKSLTPNSMYFFWVYVENSAGASPAFPIAVQTLDLIPS